MEYRVTYETGQDKYTFGHGYSKDFKIDRTETLVIQDVQYGRDDFPYIKLLHGSKETLIPKSRIIKIELIK
jgi:hypothetical protein